MRIAFYTNLTAFDSLPVLKRLGQSPNHELVHVFFYNTLSEAQKSPLKTLREFGVRRLTAKVLSTVAGRIRRRFHKSSFKSWFTPESAYELAIANNLPHSLVENLNSPDELKRLIELQVDLLLVCVCKNILRDNTIGAAKYGTLNIHPSLLPKYRGPMPVFWTLYHQEATTGVSFQRMNTKIDAGPIVAQFPVPILDQPTEATLSRQLFELAAERLEDVLSLFSQPNIPGQDWRMHEEGSYFSFPSRQQQAELRARQANRKVGKDQR
jgi:methionyl-tRNA formyltransferase